MRYWFFIGLISLVLVGCNNAENTPTAVPAPILSPQEAQGQKVFSQSCGACHSTIPDTVIVGPSLAGLGERAASRVAGQDGRSYIYTAILQPGDFLVEGYDDLMPATFGKQLTGEDLDAVVAYLMTLEE